MSKRGTQQSVRIGLTADYKGLQARCPFCRVLNLVSDDVQRLTKYCPHARGTMKGAGAGGYVLFEGVRET